MYSSTTFRRRHLRGERLESRWLLAAVPFSDPITISGTEKPSEVCAADLDGDGDLDLLSASHTWFTVPVDAPIAWYENIDGRGTFGPQQVITTEGEGCGNVLAADVDGDGDLDVVAETHLGFTDRDEIDIAWYENTDGLGTFGPQRVITALAGQNPSVNAADLDGDGDQDVVATIDIWLHNKFERTDVAWYENIDGLGSFGPQRLITTLADGGEEVLAADLDGDGDQDVLERSSWYENTDGMGTFGPGRLIVTEGTIHSAADLDGDGDQDVLSGSGDGSISWNENTDGLGTFGPQQVIVIHTSASGDVLAVDLDGNGDQDVLSASRWKDSGISWYENTDGLGTFGERQFINVVGQRSVDAADLDGDGDQDVLWVVRIDDKLGWYRNEMTGPITVDPTDGLITTEAGGAATFIVALDTEPTADVTMTLNSDDTSEGTISSSQTLTFTPSNWNTPQTVTVTGVDDTNADLDAAYSIVTQAATSADPAYNGLDPADVWILNLDDEVTKTTYDSTDVSKPLNDARGNTPGVTTSTLNVSDSFEILDLDVQLDISHNRVHELHIALISPAGARVPLAVHVGATSNALGWTYSANFSGTTFSDEATAPITAASGPFTGVFRPAGKTTDDHSQSGLFEFQLSDFDTENVQGTWTLEITDEQAKESGTLNSWSIDVTHAIPQPNDPPVITSLPVTTGTQDALYTYDVVATDPDAGDTLTYSLDVSPAGMTIDSSTGLIQWIPDSDQVGSNSVTVRVQDQPGGFDWQSFTIDVANVNDPPSITSSPVTTATEGVAYTYDVDASDPDTGESLTFSLDVSPAGMTINSSTGLVDWTPSSNHVGDQNDVIVRVTDVAGALDTQSFAIDVSAPSTATTYESGGVNIPIPDQGTITSTINVPDSGSVADLDVRVNIAHTRDADLDVFLISPQGTRVELFTDVGGGGDDFDNTVLDDAAAIAITDGSAPFAGSYRPEGSLSDLGSDPDMAGVWTLEIGDDKRRQTGTLVDWSITIETSAESSGGGASFQALPTTSSFVSGWPFSSSVTRDLQRTALEYDSGTPTPTADFWDLARRPRLSADLAASRDAESVDRAFAGFSRGRLDDMLIDDLLVDVVGDGGIKLAFS